MNNPFVYGEVVPAAAFVDRRRRAPPAVGRSGLGPEGLPHFAAAVRQVVPDPAGAPLGGARRRPDRRGDRQQLQLVPRISRRLHAGARLDADGVRAGAIVAARRDRRRQAGAPAGARPVRGHGHRRQVSERPQRPRSLAAGGRRVRAPAAALRAAGPAARRGARRVSGDRQLQRRQRRARAPRGGTAPAERGLRVRRVGAQPHGAHARTQTSVLQGGPGDAPREDPAGSLRLVHRVALCEDGHPLRSGARHRDRRSRGQHAVRRAAAGARELGRCPGGRPAAGRGGRSAPDAETASRGERDVLRGGLAASHARAAGRPAGGRADRRAERSWARICAGGTGSAARPRCRPRCRR